MNKRTKSKNSNLFPTTLLGVMILFILPYIGAFYFSKYLQWNDFGYLVFGLMCIPIIIVELIAGALLVPLLFKINSVEEKI